MRRAWVVLSAMALAACNAPGPSAPDAAAPIVRREGVSIAEATVALATLDGAPDAVAQDFRSRLARAFAARGIVEVEGGRARYRLRVYLAARPEPSGASLDYVVDVFDAAPMRLARLDEGFTLKGAGDPWSLASAEALDALADACAQNLAAFLSNAPEARPAQAASLTP